MSDEFNDDINEREETLTFVNEDGEETEFYIIGQTYINETRYLLVSEDEPENEEAYVTVLKEEGSDGEEMVLTTVEDENEVEAVVKLFIESEDDFDFEKE